MYPYKYWLWENELSNDFCDLVLKDLDFSNSKNAEIEIKQEILGYSPMRKTSIIWQPQTSLIGCVINTYARCANYYAGWNFDIDMSEEIQIGKYEEGNGQYDWHIDMIASQYGKQRKLSVSILLNDPDDFEGGNFDFDDGVEDLLKSRGSILVFPSIFKHRVKPVTKGVRYSAVSWIHGNLFK